MKHTKVITLASLLTLTGCHTTRIVDSNLLGTSVPSSKLAIKFASPYRLQAVDPTLHHIEIRLMYTEAIARVGTNDYHFGLLGAIQPGQELADKPLVNPAGGYRFNLVAEDPKNPFAKAPSRLVLRGGVPTAEVPYFADLNIAAKTIDPCNENDAYILGAGVRQTVAENQASPSIDLYTIMQDDLEAKIPDCSPNMNKFSAYRPVFEKVQSRLRTLFRETDTRSSISYTNAANPAGEKMDFVNTTGTTLGKLAFVQPGILPLNEELGEQVKEVGETFFYRLRLPKDVETVSFPENLPLGRLILDVRYYSSETEIKKYAFTQVILKPNNNPVTITPVPNEGGGQSGGINLTVQ